MAKIAIALADGFEDSEFSIPAKRLIEAGHEIIVFGSEAGVTVTGKKGKEKVVIEKVAHDVFPNEYAVLVIPGGHAPDKLRMDDDVVTVVRGFVETGKPVAAICHGPQLLIAADAVAAKNVTSWPSVRKDLLNAGANWVNQPVVEDSNLTTSRNPEDLQGFVEAILRHL